MREALCMAVGTKCSGFTQILHVLVCFFPPTLQKQVLNTFIFDSELALGADQLRMCPSS